MFTSMVVTLCLALVFPMSAYAGRPSFTSLQNSIDLLKSRAIVSSVDEVEILLGIGFDEFVILPEGTKFNDSNIIVNVIFYYSFLHDGEYPCHFWVATEENGETDKIVIRRHESDSRTRPNCDGSGTAYIRIWKLEHEAE